MSILTLGSKKRKRKEIPNQRVGESKKKRKKIPNQRMGESKKEGSSWSKKPEEMCREVFGPDNIWTIQNCHQMNKKGRKGNHDLKWSSPFDCQPKSCALATFSPRTKQKKQKKKKPGKSKAKNTQKPKEETTKRTHSQGKSYWSMITHVIFDLIGNDLQNQVMTYLWFGIRMKHLPVRDWYTLSDFLLFLSNPVFPLNGHLETKC